MNTKLLAASALVTLSLACPSDGFAKIESSTQEWQTQSLKGISSIRYGVSYDPTGQLIKTATASLKPAKVSMKSVNLKEDAHSALAPNEGRLKVFVDNRDKDQCWVGLSVEQKSLLDRNPKITYSAETYQVGELVARKDADAAIKEVCARFVQDFNAQASKGK